MSHLNDAVSSMRVREQRPNEVILYQHSNFQGLGHSGQLGNNRFVRFNDDYSSIDLPRGARIDLFEHANYGGRKISLASDAARLGLLNDRVSSYQAYRPSNIAEVASVLVGRFVLLNPSQTLNAIRWYGVFTNNSVINSVIKQVQSIAGIITGFNKVRSGDPVNGIHDLLNASPMSPWKYIPGPMKNQVDTGFRAVIGEYPNGIKISDFLK